MTWTKFDSLKQGQNLYNQIGQSTHYQWATGNKYSYVRHTIRAATVGTALAALFALLGYSIIP